MDFVGIQLSFDRAYAALLGLTKRCASLSPSRVAQAGKPHSYLDAAKEEVLNLEDLLEDLAERCPILPFTTALRRTGALHDRLLELDYAVQDPFEYRNRFQTVLQELEAVRQDLDDNGIGVRHVPWYRFWRRWLR